MDGDKQRYEREEEQDDTKQQTEQAEEETEQTPPTDGSQQTEEAESGGNEYGDRIAELNAILDDFKQLETGKVIREKMKKHNYSDEQIERYASMIRGETSEEIEESIIKLVEDIPPKVTYADPSMGNNNRRPRHKDRRGELGRELARRIKGGK